MCSSFVVLVSDTFPARPARYFKFPACRAAPSGYVTGHPVEYPAGRLSIRTLVGHQGGTYILHYLPSITIYLVKKYVAKACQNGSVDCNTLACQNGSVDCNTLACQNGSVDCNTLACQNGSADCNTFACLNGSLHYYTLQCYIKWLLSLLTYYEWPWTTIHLPSYRSS